VRIFFRTASKPYDCLSFIRKFDLIEVPKDQILVLPGEVLDDKRKKLGQSSGSPKLIFQGFVIIPSDALKIHCPRQLFQVIVPFYINCEEKSLDFLLHLWDVLNAPNSLKGLGLPGFKLNSL
jgi:hypothetical protein